MKLELITEVVRITSLFSLSLKTKKKEKIIRLDTNLRSYENQSTMLLPKQHAESIHYIYIITKGEVKHQRKRKR